jgi:hypothetical protein
VYLPRLDAIRRSSARIYICYDGWKCAFYRFGPLTGKKCSCSRKWFFCVWYCQFRQFSCISTYIQNHSIDPRHRFSGFLSGERFFLSFLFLHWCKILMSKKMKNGLQGQLHRNLRTKRRIQDVQIGPKIVVLAPADEAEARPPLQYLPKNILNSIQPSLSAGTTPTCFTREMVRFQFSPTPSSSYLDFYGQLPRFASCRQPVDPNLQNLKTAWKNLRNKYLRMGRKPDTKSAQKKSFKPGLPDGIF